MEFRKYGTKDVDAYIAESAEEARPKLEELRRLVRSTVPEAEEGISWGVPFFKYHGPLVGFAPFKNHISFGLVAALQSRDRELLEKKGYATGSKTIQIRFDQKVPVAEIKRMLKAQAKSNESKKAKK